MPCSQASSPAQVWLVMQSRFEDWIDYTKEPLASCSENTSLWANLLGWGLGLLCRAWNFRRPVVVQLEQLDDHICHCNVYIDSFCLGRMLLWVGEVQHKKGAVCAS